ncbi:uncharacterized protein KQ657_001524 [Scheffersomyces spartinae]|uniref:AB hydrolase-1 domain-containing protein n=1 Tax=Scheffersomyces spartinae TaxID=45513 RepID=A0A9P7V8C8_9ASCO|nr:uncharacterized protein KQ657_001524 [Scheffersomyces spartinae]KAG7192741.1 hypothetical protein KQ657_001524 [Scheffersomyces spartinae]
MTFEIMDYTKTNGILNHRIRFELPLNYSDSQDRREITIVATLTQLYDEAKHGDTDLAAVLPLLKNAKVIAYLQGGPGFPCTVPFAKSSFAKPLLEKDYVIIYIDQRGTGLSTPIEVGTLDVLVPRDSGTTDQDYAQQQMEYLLHFRADSIVEDFESIRTMLLGEDLKWSILGQSYGGFCSFTYLSTHAKSLKLVLITGGVPPINYGPDDVYKATYQRTKDRNVHYYNKYPGDVARVRDILEYLDSNNVTLPNGGTLSVERFQLLGIDFGHSGGTDELHQTVLKFHYDLELFGKPTYKTLYNIQNASSFDTNIIYALFQEAIYLDGNNKAVLQSNWSAERLRATETNYVFKKDADGPIYFTGEMVYKSMFDDYTELKPLKTLAHLLHKNEHWSPLYDVNTLEKLKFTDVPIVAATYYNDQYVDFDLTNKVKQQVFKGNGNLRQYITSNQFHDGLRLDSECVVGALLRLLESEVD